jgi:hypothetical protein
MPQESSPSQRRKGVPRHYSTYRAYKRNKMHGRHVVVPDRPNTAELSPKRKAMPADKQTLESSQSAK